MVDVIVIGAGPAGLSAAINVRQRGGSVVCIGLSQEDNPLYKAEKINNYLGMPNMTGAQMMEAFHAHAVEMGVAFNENRVLNAFYNAGEWMVSAGSDVVQGKAIVFTGGITRGKTYPGEQEHIGMGVSYCATCDGMLYRGKDVVVVGFGEHDQKEAAYLEEIGCHVTYISKPKKAQILDEGGRVSGIEADGQTYPAECVFILRPSLAPTTIFPGLELDGNYIKVDRDMATNLPGLFAAGDCTGTPLQIAKAVGEGMIAGQKAMALVKK